MDPIEQAIWALNILPGEKLMLLAIHRGNVGGTPFRRLAQLERPLACERSSVARYARTLRAKGYLRIDCLDGWDRQYTVLPDAKP